MTTGFTLAAKVAALRDVGPLFAEEMIGGDWRQVSGPLNLDDDGTVTWHNNLGRDVIARFAVRDADGVLLYTSGGCWPVAYGDAIVGRVE